VEDSICIAFPRLDPDIISEISFSFLFLWNLKQ
jgi:hypothetical protein